MPDLENAQTQFQLSVLSDFSTIFYEYNGAYITSIDSSTLGIPTGVTIYTRVRYYVPDIGYSEWSTINTGGVFMIAPPADIIGIAMITTGGRIGQFQTIGWSGNYISDFNYETHPIYTTLSKVTLDTNIMMEVPTIYIKTAVSGPAGSQSAGKKCWWISNKPYPGFRPAAAFKREGVIKPKIWWGTYMANSEPVRGYSTIASKANKNVYVNKTPSSFETYVNNRNTGGYTGFRLFDIWDLSLLKLLLLIFGKGTDSQAIWGDNTNHNSYPKTGTTNADALYMDDLWSVYMCIIRKISFNDDTRNIQLINPMDNTIINTDTTTAGLGWMVDVVSGEFTIGTSANVDENQHDLMELFLPSVTTGSESDATFADYLTLYTNSPYTFLSGGKWNDWSVAGLFNLDNSYWDGTGYGYIGCRLAKH